MNFSTDSAFEKDGEDDEYEVEGDMSRENRLIEARIDYILALERAVQIEKGRANYYKEMSSKSLNLLEKILAERRTSKEKISNLMLTQECLKQVKPLAEAMVEEERDKKDDMMIVANAIMLYTLEICTLNNTLNPVEEFEKIKKNFENVGVRCK